MIFLMLSGILLLIPLIIYRWKIIYFLCPLYLLLSLVFLFYYLKSCGVGGEIVGLEIVNAVVIFLLSLGLWHFVLKKRDKKGGE